jgi:hypothetical protein
MHVGLGLLLASYLAPDVQGISFSGFYREILSLQGVVARQQNLIALFERSLFVVLPDLGLAVQNSYALAIGIKGV